ncbi:MAG: SEL1-like repeat protein [Gammaproteobacteria bacterium]|nr:SEL1-like repeat protein [Gammaproteobacteria bacterium]
MHLGFGDAVLDSDAIEEPPPMKRLLFALLLAAPLGFAAAGDPPGLDQLRVAADKGEADAQYELGVLYEYGFRFPDHKANAFVWYSRAAEQGHAQAAKRRDLLKSQMSTAEMGQAQKLLPIAATTATSTSTSEPTTPQ